jgi:hypothetical protein
VLSSYNYNILLVVQAPPQMEAFILELVALDIACHAGGLGNYETTKRWTELIYLGRGAHLRHRLSVDTDPEVPPFGASLRYRFSPRQNVCSHPHST